MTDLDAALVRRKLALIVRNLADLETVRGIGLTEYTGDRFRKKGVERLLQETVEAAVDVNLHVLRAEEAPTPPDYFESFVRLGRHGVIPEELAQTLAPSAGLRNRLVHEYDEIDDSIVLVSIDMAVREFGRYVSAMERYLENRGL